MAKNVDVITAALQELNVIGETGTPSPEQGAYCLSQMNDMLESWTENEINLGYFAQSLTTADCPVPAWALSGVKVKLAEFVASHYGSTISPELGEKIREQFGMIQRKCLVEGLKPANMDHMARGDGHGGFVDITTIR